MKETIKLTCVLLTLTLLLTACGGGGINNVTVNNTAKPGNAANSNNASTTNSTSSTKKTTAPKARLTDEKKPTEGKAKTAKSNPVPDSWIYVYDENKGYGFSVPEGSTGGAETMEGIDVFAANTPAPNDIAVIVLAYKDKTLSKEDLLDHAVKFLEGLGLTVTPGKLKGESEDYAVADATSVSKEGVKEKQRILVGTDVSDNYVMILSTEEAKFAAGEKTIDEIWGSFEMWSGGASGDN